MANKNIKTNYLHSPEGLSVEDFDQYSQSMEKMDCALKKIIDDLIQFNILEVAAFCNSILATFLINSEADKDNLDNFFKIYDSSVVNLKNRVYEKSSKRKKAKK